MGQMWASKKLISERIFTYCLWLQELWKNKLNLFLDGMTKWPKKKKKDNCNKITNLTLNGLFLKKTKQGGWGYGISIQGYQRDSMSNFQGFIKNKVEFLGLPRKNNVEYPGVLDLGLGIGLFQKKNQTGGVEDIIFWNPPGNFRFVTIPLEISVKTSFLPWKFSKIVRHLLETPRSKTKTHQNSTWVLTWTPLEILLLF